MKAIIEIDAGVCGFKTNAAAVCEDGQNIVSFKIESDCENIRALAPAISALVPVDAYEEISAARASRIMACCREKLKGCCSACAVPVGIFKGMQVAAELALPQDIAIRIEKEDL